ncbi:hypothetical protein TTHERM_00441820 (macronuclear) [Tetrahymena thermophila SB210]|uniref:Uncharacterized protein n=1 Tax=Tetrahymena thermophila (strain SB210) TaxID=312017 RepID=I7LTK8_TETTS|nr:hypothetical protein TTHERM_00441820 [Tetrahymena thermophila SB210]EAR85434.1 hypothetical protein TTHERM_00441820 [Tetrahymena thermophila SB210]|eukprot:XP_001033097.1 hypothetical protein TTHERM_00441820 [Tetrahymena thermophila SB210]
MILTPLHCKVLQPQSCEFKIVKQPFFKPKKITSCQSNLNSCDSTSTSSFESQIENQDNQINTSIITIQTFKGVNSQFILSTCYMQNDEKFSCNYLFDKQDYQNSKLIPLEVKAQKVLNTDFSQEIVYPVPKKMIKTENKIQQSKNAAKNITKAFIRYMKDIKGDDDKNYKELTKFIKKHKYNNKNLKTIAQKPSYALDFKNFCNGQAQEWVDSCNIQDKEMHLRIINAFKNQDYEMLKEHKKRVKKRYSL